MDLTVREAVESDIPDIREVAEASWRRVYRDIHPPATIEERLEF